MLGLFMLLPVFSVHAHEYPGHTPLLVGVAIGIYGLTQGMFQVPFGVLSDRFGRRPVIAAGLLVFALGSVVAAVADDIWGVVAGRALQGTGAVAAAVMALASDLTGEAHRTRVMAVIGASIGAAFALALVLGPVITELAGVSGLFWVTAALAAVAIVLLYLGVPAPPRMAARGGSALAGLGTALRDGQMVRLNAGIFILHAVMVATFVALPIALRDRAGVDVADHWKVYVGVLLASVVFTVPLIVVADRANRSRTVMLLGIVLLGAALAGLAGAPAGGVALMACLVVYFTGFNTLEASLPAMVSRVAPMRARGAALGVYSTIAVPGGVRGRGPRRLAARRRRRAVGARGVRGALRRMGADRARAARAPAAQRRAVAGGRCRTRFGGRADGAASRGSRRGRGRRRRGGAHRVAAGRSPESGSKRAARVLFGYALRRLAPGFRPARDADAASPGRRPTLCGTMSDTGRGVRRYNLPGRFVKYLEGASSTRA